jgi:magnesium-transporting ATPase (P-type)
MAFEPRRFVLLPGAGVLEEPSEQQKPDGTALRFCSNEIHTSRYTAFNFLPKNLFEQFRRAANIYFICVVILMTLGWYGDRIFDSPLNPASLGGPLIMVMAITAVKDAKEDYKRHAADKEENERLATVCTLSGETTMHWQDLRVGMLVKVTTGDFFPADLILVSSSSQGGKCYVETSGIDGETNLKQKKCPAGVQDIVTAALAPAGAAGARAAAERVAAIECETPNKDIHHFEGTLVDGPNNESTPPEAKSPLGSDNLLLRAAQLRNTAHILGAVVFTGRESKIQMNSRKSPSKLASLEKAVNHAVVAVLSIMLCVVLVSAAVAQHAITEKAHSDLSYLLYPDDLSDVYRLPSYLAYVFTFIVLFSNFIPLSLYVTLEMVNLAQVSGPFRWEMVNLAQVSGGGWAV